MQPETLSSRDYSAERASAQNNLKGKLLIASAARDENTLKDDVLQVATSFLLCGLPYRPTNALKIVHNARTASGTMRVTFLAVRSNADGSPIPMARGADRTFLYWCLDRAIKTRSAFVPLNSAKDFLRDMRLSDHGKNFRRLRETHRRLSGLAVVVERFNGRAGEESKIMPVICESRLPASIGLSDSVCEESMGIRFGAEFFSEFSRKGGHAIFPWSLFRAFTHRPKMQDYMMFLHYRCAIAQTESPIPWDYLRDQLWQADSNPRRLRMDLVQAIAALGKVWPGLNAVADRDALRIGPPLGGRLLLPF